MNVKESTVSMILVICVALVAIMNGVDGPLCLL